MQLSTPRLLIRPVSSEDAEPIFRNYAQDQEVVKYLTWKAHASVDETKAFVASCLSQDKTRNESLVLFHKELHETIGMLGFRFDGFQVNFGYVLARRFWNQGLMTEAVEAALAMVLARPEVFRVWAAHALENEASGTVMKKAGMQYEGIFRRFVILPNLSDEPWDMKIYSIVK